MRLDTFGQQIAHIDLAAGTTEGRPAPEAWVQNYIGARGLGVRYVLEAGPGVDPLGPDNALCFMNGPLTGSEASMSGRLFSYSPVTGQVTLHWQDLYFANGVALGPNDSFVLVNETGAGRIQRLWLKGERAGQRDRLPAVPRDDGPERRGPARADA